MNTETCTECEGLGFEGVDWLTGVPCYFCDGRGWVKAPTLRQRLRTRFYRTRLGRRVTRTRRQIEWARARWRERDAKVIAAVQAVHREVMQDEPRLRSLVDHELRRQLIEVTPLRWRLADARWALDNMKRAMRGEPMNTDLPYEDVTSIEFSEQNRDLFERNAVMIRAERHRRSPLTPEQEGRLRDYRAAGER